MTHQYVCTLDERSLEVAKNELNEIPSDRLSAVEHLRKWVLEQRHLKSPTDTEFLLRFLRVCKFSQLAARKMLEGYWQLRSCIGGPEWFGNLDPLDARIQMVLDSGFVFPLPGRDDQYKRVLVFQMGAFDPNCKAYSPVDLIRTVYVVASLLMSNENNVVNGYTYFMDLTGFSMKHMTYFSLDLMKKSWISFQGRWPGRFKKFVHFNVGPVFDLVFKFMEPFLPEKARKRTFVFGCNMEDVYNHIPMRMLPEEFLPDDYDGPNGGTVAEIIANLKEELSKPANRNAIMRDGNPEYGFFPAKKPKDKEAIIQSSYRKLNVD